MKLEKINRKIVEADLHYSYIQEYIVAYLKNGVFYKIKALMKKLNLSKNTCKMLVVLCKDGKEAFFRHYLKNKSSSKKYPLALKKMIAKRYRCYLKNFAIHEQTQTCFNSFYEDWYQGYIVDGKVYYPKSSYIHSALLEEGFTSKLGRRRTQRNREREKREFERLRLLDEKMIDEIVKDSLMDIVEETVTKLQNAKVSKQTAFQPGERMEQDGWEFYIANSKATLTIAVDSATGCMLSAYVTPTETNTGHLLASAQAIATHGKPKGFVADRRQGIYGDGKAQIRDMLKLIDINVTTTSNPDGKAVVERSNRTINCDYVYQFMCNERIMTIDAFNQKSRKFIEGYNKKYNKIIPKKNMFTDATWKDFESMKVDYKIRVNDDQLIYFQGKIYGVADQRGDRVTIAPGDYDMTIDHMNKMKIDYIGLNLYLDKDYIGKKSKHLTKDFIIAWTKECAAGKKVTTSELAKVLKIINYDLDIIRQNKHLL